jgi:prepilin peptidase dependent protein B
MLKNHQNGLTLIELMIGLLVGAIVVAGAITVFSGSVKNSTDNINLTRLNQDLRAMMDMMERDIRRAGYVTSDPAANMSALQNNPFFNSATAGATTDISILAYGGSADNCILYAYNRDSDSPVIVDSNERLGFRLDSGGELDMRRSGTTNANCTDGSWESITEPEVEITALTFGVVEKVLNVSSMMTDTDNDGCLNGDDQNPAAASSSCRTGNYGNGFCDSGEDCNTCTRDGSPDPACLYIRTLTIMLAGRLKDDNTATQTITEQVRIRNDKYLAAVP